MRRVVAALLLLALAGCGPAYGEPFVRAFFEAKRAYNAGRYEEAADLYEKAAAAAQRIKDRDEAYFMRARMFERLQRWDDAAAEYRALARRSPRGPRTPRAVFELAELTIRQGDEAKGWELLRDAVDTYPDHGSARHALTLYVERLSETQGEENVREYLRGRLGPMEGTDAEQQLKYELARSLERSGDLKAAHATYLRAAREHPYPRGSLTDDAHWRASHVAERMGDHELAIADLREPLSVRESGGDMSYERPRFPAMQLRIAELYRDRIGDLRAARRELRRTYENHPHALIADDALWAEALLARRMGDGQGVCELMERLNDDFSQSRYRRCAVALCPTLSPPPRTDGRPCPPYIRRTFEPVADEPG